MEQPAALLLPEQALDLLQRHFGARARRAPGQLIPGSTNLVVQLTLARKAYAVRVPRPDTAHIAIDRRSECAALTAAADAGLAPSLVVCDPTSGILITHWVKGELWTAQRAREERAIRLVAVTLKRLHALSPPAAVRSLAPLPLLRSYWQLVGERAAALAPRLASLHARVMTLAADAQNESPVLCHADLHHRNLIGAGELTLLDWEYSGLVDPHFDLASYAQSNDLEPVERERLLEAYGPSLHGLERFGLYCLLFDWVCVLWLATVGGGERPPERERMELLILRVKSSMESA